MTKLVAVRDQSNDVTSCSGCGNYHKVLYIVRGRYDYEEYISGHWPPVPDDQVIVLCGNCFRPIRSKVELITK